MAGWLRQAGTGFATDGAHVTWSVAEGSRGRRWREVVVTADGKIRSSLLLELDPDGRFSHLELSTAAGLLTLHPEGDGTLHGNAVTADGIHHIRGLPWARDSIIGIEGSTVAQVVALRTRSSAGAGGSGAGLRIGLDLQLARLDREPPLARERDAGSGPRPRGDGELPDLVGGNTWPLEGQD